MKYLREVKFKRDRVIKKELSIFEGDVATDREYWIKYQYALGVRYFRLEEVKEDG